MPELTNQSESYYQTGTGWICPTCGLWVAASTYHACCPVHYSPLIPTWGPDWERLVAVLERIAAALDRLKPGMIPSHDDVEELYK